MKPLFVTISKDNVSIFPSETRLFSELDKIPVQLHHSIKPRLVLCTPTRRKKINQEEWKCPPSDGMLKDACKNTSLGSDGMSWEDWEDECTSWHKRTVSLVDIKERGEMVRSCSSSSSPNPSSSTSIKMSGHGSIDTYPCTFLAWSSLVQDGCQEDTYWDHWGCAGARHWSFAVTMGARLWQQQVLEPTCSKPSSR